MQSDPLERIEKRFNYNINRVSNLMSLFDLLNTLSKKKNESHKGDLLRSAVVLLHATLEDLLREAIRSRPSLDNEKFIKSLMLEADGNKNRAKERFGIIDLLEHKDLAVSEILNKSISHHLDRRSFNHIGDVKEALIQIGVSHAEFKVLLPVIGKAIERRHKIVHRSDRTEHSEKTHGPPTTIGKLTVEEWTKSIGRFGVLLLRELKEKQPPAPLQLKQQA